MLPLSDVIITLKSSNDFLKCIVILHLAAGILLLQSSLPLLWICLLFIPLLLSMFYSKKNNQSPSGYRQLSYQQTYWLLEHHDGHQLRINRVHINFDGGFFLLLLLTNENTKKRIVLFNDQLTNKQHRELRILSRIT